VLAVDAYPPELVGSNVEGYFGGGPSGPGLGLLELVVGLTQRLQKLPCKSILFRLPTNILSALMQLPQLFQYLFLCGELSRLIGEVAQPRQAVALRVHGLQFVPASGVLLADLFEGAV
jgi:hypothetical protein